MEISAKRADGMGAKTFYEYSIYDLDTVQVTMGLPGNRVRVIKFKDGVEPRCNISDELLQRIVQSAFKAGENWGVQYQGLYTPTAVDHKKMMSNAIRAARKVVKRSNNKKA
jgi:hypothetical protein